MKGFTLTPQLHILAMTVIAPALLAALLYLPTLHAGLAWDDPLVLHHPLYLPPVDWNQALSRPFVLSPNYYRPLAVFTLAALGDAPAAQHALNLALHAPNTALVGALAWQMAARRPALPAAGGDLNSGAGPGFWVVAGWLYAVHPALVEPVAFIAGRFDLLVTTFLLLALLADAASGAHAGRRAMAVGLCALLAALSKEMAIVLPAALLAWQWAREGAPRDRRAFAQRHALSWAGALGGLLVYLAVRYAALGYLYLPQPERSLPVGGPLNHALLVARSLVEYVVLAVWPFTTLTPIHHSPLPLPLAALEGWIGLGLAVLILLGLVR